MGSWYEDTPSELSSQLEIASSQRALLAMTNHIHFVGIGGAGLSALAQVMLGRGVEVSGSDPAAPNAVTDSLERLGAKIYAGHDAKNIAGADLMVVTSAAQSDNPEIEAAHLQQIPILKRREFLREMTQGFDVIAIAGSHGKTTTTAMIGLILAKAGLDPTVVVGGAVPGWGTNARVGMSKWFVIEADEYDYAFMGLDPKITVVTNVDYDHPDLFPTRELYIKAFADFLKQTRADGVMVVCGEETAAKQAAGASATKLILYGMGQGNAWRAGHVTKNTSGGSDFEIWHENDLVGNGSLKIPGTHNVLNGLAAVAAANEAGVEPKATLETLAEFGGVGRRFQILGTFHGATIVEDYAHHPTEIRVNVEAARSRFPKARVWVLFQPHTFSRTRALLSEFADALRGADRVLITEIFAAREQDDSGLSSRAIVELIQGQGARYVATLDKAEEILREELSEGDVLLVLGAGDVNQVAKRLVENVNA